MADFCSSVNGSISLRLHPHWTLWVIALSNQRMSTEYICLTQYIKEYPSCRSSSFRHRWRSLLTDLFCPHQESCQCLTCLGLIAAPCFQLKAKSVLDATMQRVVLSSRRSVWTARCSPGPVASSRRKQKL